MSEPIPTWLQRHLEAKGLWDADGISRHARVRRCRRCRRRVIVGLDSDLCAGEAICDYTPLSKTGEAVALILGRRTYSLRWISNRLELDLRDDYRIRGRPADMPSLDVVAEHDCGSSAVIPSTKSVHELWPIDYSGDPPY